MMPAVLSNSLSVMLLPEISKAQACRQENHIRGIIKKTAELSCVLGLLCTLGFLLTRRFYWPPAVPQPPGRGISENALLDLPVYFSGQHSVQHPSGTWETRNRSGRQYLRLRCADLLYPVPCSLYGNAGISLGHAGKPDRSVCLILAVPAKKLLLDVSWLPLWYCGAPRYSSA